MTQNASPAPVSRERLLADGYAHAALVQPGSSLVFVSGQIPTRSDGSLPAGFEAQCRQAWANIGEVLAAAEMTLRDIVKVTTFLASRDDRDASRRIRMDVLGETRPAVTVIITGIYDENWLLEIEAVAAKQAA